MTDPAPGGIGPAGPGGAGQVRNPQASCVAGFACGSWKGGGLRRIGCESLGIARAHRRGLIAACTRWPGPVVTVRVLAGKTADKAPWLGQGVLRTNRQVLARCVLPFFLTFPFREKQAARMG